MIRFTTLLRRPGIFIPGLLALSLAACSDPTPESQPPEGGEAAAPTGALTIETAEAVAASGVPLGSVPGRVTLPPDARHAVTSPFPGAAIRVYVIEGQAVSRGQPLALVRASESVSVSGDLARAQAELDVAESQAARITQLAEEGIVAQARADEAAARLRQARASLAEAQRLAAMAGTGPDGSMTLRAPIAGRVAHVGIDTGEMVGDGPAPFIVEASGPLRVTLQLPERLAQQVRPGMAVEVQLPGSEAEAPSVAGQILSVAPSIEADTRSVMATATIATAPGLVAGQNVMVVISGAGDGTGVSVPSAAVTRIGGENHVFVREGEDFVAREVTVASSAGGRAVISEGLVPGEVVATSSITELKAANSEESLATHSH